MSTKLTLTVDKRVIEEAKKYAKKQGRSLSNLIEDYLKLLIEPQSPANDEFEYTPIVRSLKGSVKVGEEDFDYTEVLEEELMKKYLTDQ